ncbi:MAG: Bro-N domain-containing protein, partial [Candidatus Fonsibacter sp.]
YADTDQAIRKHVDNEYKKKMEELRPVNLTGLTYRDLKSVYINEPGLYKLIFSSNMKAAKAFTDWVCSEVLPSIRQTGSFMTKEQAIKRWKLIDDDMYEAQYLTKNPKGEKQYTMQ